ncbi:MAG: DUF4338 domain-containing protein [Methylococcaceae bacterium]|nr:DUF4338 domain-containing protein [Methylococcaceae bacterium]
MNDLPKFFLPPALIQPPFLNRPISTIFTPPIALRPWLAETFVDSSRFTGHCYRAANRIDVGLTTGRGRQDRDHQRHGTAPKRILLYPLHHDAWQRLLRSRYLLTYPKNVQ